MIGRRRQRIEHLCRSYLTRKLSVIPEEYEMELTVPIHTTDVAAYIEGVGDRLFSIRPATAVYVSVFLEYVLRICETMEVGVDVCVPPAANVIERTRFDSDLGIMFVVIGAFCILLVHII